jgi:hypothetical protein
MDGQGVFEVPVSTALFRGAVLRDDDADREKATMSNTSHDTNAASCSKDIMKGLVAAAAMMAEGNTIGKSNKSHDSNQAIANIMSTSTSAPFSKSASSTSRKTKNENEAIESSSDDDDDDDRGVVKNSGSAPTSDKTKAEEFFDVHVARARRLEQNRRAAIESRRRKKVMIAELQRSVTFYTKANDSLKLVNLDLEQRLFLARQRVLSKQRVLQALDASREKSTNSFEPIQIANQLPVASAASVPFPSMHVSVSPAGTDQSQAHTSASKTPYELAYPPGDQVLLQNAFPHVIGLSGVIPSNMSSANTYNYPAGPSLDAKQSASDTNTSKLPSEKEIDGDKYLESLRMVRLL